MTRTKRFKTVLGYLRHESDSLSFKQEMARLHGQPVISDENGEREILHRLLPQVEVTDRIGDDEKLIEGLRRLRANAQTDRARKSLDDCIKWASRTKCRTPTRRCGTTTAPCCAAPALI